MADLIKELETALVEALKGDGLTAKDLAALLEPILRPRLRRTYAGVFLWLIVGLDAAVVGLVLLVGLRWLVIGQQVLMTLIGATVVQTGSVCYLIAKHLFPEK